MEKPIARVLLAEDDRFLRRACEVSLRRQGFTVLTAADGEEALRVARTETPQLILLDLLMPKITGIEVLRILRSDENTRAIPVIVLTNSSSEQNIQQGKSLGIARYLVKSDLSLDELGKQVRQALEECNHGKALSKNPAR